MAKQTYAFSVEAIRRAIQRLTANSIHEHFAGYLAILRALRTSGSQTARSSDITEFHDRYLLAPGAPEKSPYIRPFKSRGKGLELFNANVAGSYAPSSLRARGKLINVIGVEGNGLGASYSLRATHAKATLESLLKGKRVPTTSLAAFLYRDYGFELEKPQIARVLKLFRDEFGLRQNVATERETFNTVFEDDSDDFKDSDLRPHGKHG